MDNTRHSAPSTATPTPTPTTDSVDADCERQLDDLDDLDDDDCFESLGDSGVPDELERLGGYSESTAFEDPPLE
jgi:hypothetical protein